MEKKIVFFFLATIFVYSLIGPFITLIIMISCTMYKNTTVESKSNGLHPHNFNIYLVESNQIQDNMIIAGDPAHSLTYALCSPYRHGQPEILTCDYSISIFLSPEKLQH